MNTPTHTPEPLEACNPGDYTDLGGKSIVIIEGEHRRVLVVAGDDERSIAMTDKLVTAYNATYAAGMDPAAVGEMAKAISQPVGRFPSLREYLAFQYPATHGDLVLMAALNALESSLALTKGAKV